jgi:hypothetical protein
MDKSTIQRIFINKLVMFTVGSVCRVKRYTTEWQSFADGEEVETEMWKWLTQQSKDFYPTCFDALVKRCDKCINVGGGYAEK